MPVLKEADRNTDRSIAIIPAILAVLLFSCCSDSPAPDPVPL
jgi:hypothetical protein